MTTGLVLVVSRLLDVPCNVFLREERLIEPKTLQIRLASSSSHSVLTTGQPVAALNRKKQAPDRLTTGVPVFKSLA